MVTNAIYMCAEAKRDLLLSINSINIITVYIIYSHLYIQYLCKYSSVYVTSKAFLENIFATQIICDCLSKNLTCLHSN